MRRPDERRRRVMMTATTDGETPRVTTAHATLRLREAPRKSVAYGSRVRRCLRGRWFSLVPMSTWSMTCVGGCVLTLAVTLATMHYLTFRIPALGSRPDVQAVLRLDAPGSLGRYSAGLLFLVTAGVSQLIYQLRRYRNDDFSGQYRLWRSVTLACVLASFAVVVPLVPMAGSLLEWTIGQRVALTGADWVSLLMTLAATVLALRLVAEVWHDRAAVMWMLGGWAVAAIPVAVRWNLFAVDTPLPFTIASAAHLVAASMWLIASASVLRRLYGDVRGIERPEPVWQRAFAATRQMCPSMPSLPSWRSSKEQDVAPEPKTAERSVDEPDSSEKAPAEKRRGWFSRRPKPDPVDSTNNTPPVAKQPPPKTPPKPAPVPVQAVAKPSPQADPTDADADSNADAPEPKKRRFGLGGFFQRKATAESDDADDDETDDESETRPSPGATPGASPGARGNASADDADDDDSDGDDEELDEDGNKIDWSGMSKSERRRVRKQLKRGGRAA